MTTFIISAIFFGLGAYIGVGLCVYLYCVLINYVTLKRWYFNIEDGRIGGVPYPKWLLIWLEDIVKSYKDGRHVE